MPIPDAHRVNGNPLMGPWPEGFDTLVVGMGCFWGVERQRGALTTEIARSTSSSLPSRTTSSILRPGAAPDQW